jgi:predicted nucleic acid-binding protein
MTTAIGTDVVIALWDKDPKLSLAAQSALEAAFSRGTLIAAVPVFAELIAAPGRSEAFVGSFFEETGIGVDWELPEQIWRLAGRAFQAYSERRRRQRDAGARRILADFVIGSSCIRERLSPSHLRRSALSLLISHARGRDLLRSPGPLDCATLDPGAEPSTTAQPPPVLQE